MAVKYIDQEDIDLLQKLGLEKESRQNIISYIISNGFNIHTQEFQEYNNEYFQFYKQFEEQKEYIISKYLGKNYQRPWNIIYSTRELIYEE